MDPTNLQAVQAHISSTFVPLSAVTRLSSGSYSSIFRGTTLSPLPLPPQLPQTTTTGADAATTVIIKHAVPIMAANLDVVFDTIRCVR